MEQRLSLVTLGVADLQLARRFYEVGLGWRVSDASQPGIVFFQLLGMVMALYPRQALADDTGVPNMAPQGFSGIVLAHNVRSREDVSVVLQTAVQAGGKLLKPAQDAFWGGHSGCFADIDGHAWEVAWNPFWTLADDGSVKLVRQDAER